MNKRDGDPDDRTERLAELQRTDAWEPLCELADIIANASGRGPQHRGYSLEQPKLGDLVSALESLQGTTMLATLERLATDLWILKRSGRLYVDQTILIEGDPTQRRYES